MVKKGIDHIGLSATARSMGPGVRRDDIEQGSEK
jgi:hypothetical protein